MGTTHKNVPVLCMFAMFAKIIYSINISIDKMRVIGFVAPWILLPNRFQTFPLIVLALPRLVNVTLQ